MAGPPATIGDALLGATEGGAEPGWQAEIDAAVASAIEELARDRDARNASARGMWIAGPRGSGKSAILTRIEAAIADPTQAGEPALRAAIERISALDPIVVRVDLASLPHASIAHALTSVVAAKLGAEPPPAPPSPRAMADEISAICRAKRPSSRLVCLLLDDAGALDREVLRPIAVHLLLRGKGRVAVIATGEAPPRDEGGALEGCFPDAQRVSISERALAEMIHERALRKTEEARAALATLDPDGAALYPIDPSVLDRIVRVTSTLERDRREIGAPTAPVPGPLAVVADMIARASSRSFGSLSTIDDAFETLAPWLPEGVVATVDRAAEIDPAAVRVARAIAILEPLAPARPATREELETALRDRIDAKLDDVDLDGSIESLTEAGLVFHTTRHGCVLTTPSIAAWNADRASADVTGEEISQIVRDELAELLDAVSPPEGTHFRAVYADGRRAHDEAILDRGGGAAIPLDVRHLPLYRRTREEWLGRSVRGNLLKRLIWIAEGDLPTVQEAGRELARSRRQLRRAAPVLGRPSRELARLLDLEAARRDDLGAAMRAAVERTFLAGTFYFRGEAMPARSLGDRFGTALLAACARVIPRIFGSPELPAPSAAPPADEITVELPRGREVRSAADLEALLGDIERQVRAALDRGATRVKIV